MTRRVITSLTVNTLSSSPGPAHVARVEEPASGGTYGTHFARGVDRGWRQEVNFMFKHVLVALDGSEYSQAALPTAIEVTRKFGADLFVIHVAEHDRGRAVAYSEETPYEAAQLVGKAVKLARDSGVAAKGELRDIAAGHVAKVIVETAEANEADLIVMGSRGLSDIQGLLLGSVTHKVMQLTQVSVLVARGPFAVKDAAKLPSFATAAAPA
jgi:nucleotide-binding universal stress UspA family protein